MRFTLTIDVPDCKTVGYGTVWELIYDIEGAVANELGLLDSQIDVSELVEREA